MTQVGYKRLAFMVITLMTALLLSVQLAKPAAAASTNIGYSNQVNALSYCENMGECTAYAFTTDDYVRVYYDFYVGPGSMQTHSVIAGETVYNATSYPFEFNGGVYSAGNITTSFGNSASLPLSGWSEDEGGIYPGGSAATSWTYGTETDLAGGTTTASVSMFWNTGVETFPNLFVNNYSVTYP